jgi:CheY-like chemotaxis protein
MATILIVDDHASSLVALECVLEQLEQDVVCAASGGDALDVVANKDVALIVTDLRMRDMSGAELITRVRHGGRNAHVPVIVFSGVDDDDPTLSQALQDGVEFLQKPCQPRSLLAHVRAKLQ